MLWTRKVFKGKASEFPEVIKVFKKVKQFSLELTLEIFGLKKVWIFLESGNVY